MWSCRSSIKQYYISCDPSCLIFLLLNIFREDGEIIYIEEIGAGIKEEIRIENKISGRHISNYAENTTLMAGNKKDLKIYLLLLKAKEES